MQMRFFLLGDENKGSNRLLSAELKEIFSEYLTNNGAVQSFPSIREANTSVAKAFADSHVVFFLAEPSVFSETKNILSRAFGFELKRNDEIFQMEDFSAISETEKTDFVYKHAFVPVGSRLFSVEDGLYTGFSVVSGNQTIIFLPLERQRTLYQLSLQVIPYLNSVYHITIDFSRLKSWHFQKLDSAAERENALIAFSNTDLAPFVQEYFASSQNLTERIKVTPSAEKRNGLNPEEYVKNLSIAAAELLNCRYGVAVSNVFYRDDDGGAEKTVYIAVTNDRETQIRSFNMFRGERIENFINRICLDLCVFMEDMLDADEGFGKYVKKKEKKVAKQYKILIAVVAVIIAAIIAFGAVFFAKNDYSIGDWAENIGNFLFPTEDNFDNDVQVTNESSSEILTYGTNA